MGERGGGGGGGVLKQVWEVGGGGRKRRVRCIHWYKSTGGLVGVGETKK